MNRVSFWSSFFRDGGRKESHAAQSSLSIIRPILNVKTLLSFDNLNFYTSAD